MMYVLLAVVILLLYVRSVSNFETKLLAGHSFELASQVKDKHNELWGNFYFYFKDPSKVTMF
jgi:hypothetical protein